MSGDRPAYYTVAQAAHLLQVSHSTVWRWIEAGRIPAYRVGPKALRIKQQDLEQVIHPAYDRGKDVTQMQEQEQRTILPQPRTLTDEDVAQGLAALKTAAVLRAAQLARRGKPFSSSVELVRHAREELSHRL